MKISRLQSQSGQMATEMVLMIVVSVGIAMMIASSFKKNEVVANLVSTPWSKLQGLIQNGVYGSPADTMAKHPAGFIRVSSPRADPPE